MSLSLTPRIERIAARVTGRPESLFATDLQAQDAGLEAALTGARVLVAGGAGTIGAATITEILRYRPAALGVIDPSENNLAELLRMIRNREPAYEGEVAVAPVGYGSALAQRFLADQAPYDWVLTFAALKHVRSERDLTSLARMLEVNLLDADTFLATCRRQGHGRRGLFMVSTDKAARPVSLMGASKRAMEQLLWAHTSSEVASLRSGGATAPPLPRVTTTRFANVAFSDGSLPWAFLQRLEKGQPLALPGDVARYLVSPREAGQLCLLTAFVAPHRHVTIPRLDADRDLVGFEAVALATLEEFGLVAERYDDEAEARRAVPRDRAAGRYPVLITRADTSGEKPVEEFVADGEEPVDIGLAALRGIPAPAEVDAAGLAELLARIHGVVHDAGSALGKDELTAAIAVLVPDFHHVDTGQSLDARM